MGLINNYLRSNEYRRSGKLTNGESDIAIIIIYSSLWFSLFLFVLNIRQK